MLSLVIGFAGVNSGIFRLAMRTGTTTPAADPHIFSLIGSCFHLHYLGVVEEFIERDDSANQCSASL
jgi:hypothetical protein